MQIDQFFLVECDIAHRVDLADKLAFHHLANANADVVLHSGRDFHHAVFIAFVFINRHQIHTHGRLAGLIAAVIGVHGCNPVFDFLFASSGAPARTTA